ncbi:hypothetical protein C8Q78DRAFT_1171319 [Trametes maxima]|nr:hypothetical protein C8Q78DRAFT_1171319 [Trametes maxima]
MDGSIPGEIGVLAWCSTIRFNMAKDPGRQILHDQIQKQGFDFLDSYLESFFDGPKDEPVIELLKTPGRKRNAPVRTRAGIAAAEKSRAVTSLSFDDNDTKENGGPVNEFQKALLRAKEKADEDIGRQPPRSQQQLAGQTIKPSVSFAKLKTQHIVTIADSPAVPATVHDDQSTDLDQRQNPLPAVNFRLQSSFDPPSAEENLPERHAESVDEDHESVNELSMIAEDEEPAEKSRVSLTMPAASTKEPSDEHAEILGSVESQDTFHDALQEPAESDPMQTDEYRGEHMASASVSEVSALDDVISASAGTLHSIALDSPRIQDSTYVRQPVHAVDHHTAPLPKVSLPPVPVEDDVHSHTAPLPSTSSRHEEYTMPLREPSAPVPGLSRKPSMPQFSGLPAPSPLRKSLRVPGDPIAASGGGATTIPPGGKRTSWLSKARETKALETTAKRTSALGHGVGLTALSNKRKSGEMIDSARDVFAAPNTVFKALEEEQRHAKVPKLTGSPADLAVDGKGKEKSSSPDVESMSRLNTSHDILALGTVTSNAAEQDESDVLDAFKKVTTGYSARAGKSMGKSLGGNAAAALAEARARAEARVAERHKLEMGLSVGSEDVLMTSDDKPAHGDLASAPVTHPTNGSKESERRLSVSDLVPSTQGKEKDTVAPSQRSQPPDADTSTSTTPPHSPPAQPHNASFMLPSGPVFSKPVVSSAPRAPTTVPPTRGDTAAPGVGRDFSFKLPPNPFSIPAAMALGMGGKFVPLSAQSSKASIFSDVVFDSSNASPQPSWMPSTQDTSYSAGGSQSQGVAKSNYLRDDNDADDADDLDEDDSWGVDEKFAAHQTWTPFGFSNGDGDQVMKDDTMTWSTLPSRSTSQRAGDTGSVQPTQGFFSALPQSKEEEDDEQRVEESVQQDLATQLEAAANQPSDADEGTNEEADIAMEIDDDVEEEQEAGDVESGLEDAVFSGKPTVTLVQQPKADVIAEPRSDSQQSMASTTSSSQQSQLGFFGQASKLVSSVLGGSKKGKPEVKSLQLAAAAAKKQQEEREKKTARLKEMENRRQQAMQRKADEEKARALEEERKIKEEAERRRREREEHTDKRPLRSTTTAAKKADEDNTKKRELVAKVAQKPPSKDKKDPVPPRVAKPGAGPSASSSKSSALPKSALKQPGSSVPPTPGGAKAAPKALKHVPSTGNLKSAAAMAKGKERAPTREPSEQPPAPKPTKVAAPAGPVHHGGPPAEPPRVASESIELPEINSEYSDSEDEDRPKRILPEWAQSPGIAAALQQQSTINPDDIFGRIGPLRMEEIFRTRQSRFRARTSSANWTGTDELTAEEEREYARRMGFR